MKRILFLPPEPWYVQHHMEYLIRYLGGEYFMEQASIGSEPYAESAKADPTLANPDEYDLLIPLLATHPRVDSNKYKHKLAMILWEPNEGQWHNTVAVAATTPIAAKSMEEANHPHVYVTPGIDAELFEPFSQAREDDLLHIGIIGCPHNTRHRVKDIMLKLVDIPGTKFTFYVRNWLNRPHDIEAAGGEEFHKRIASGDTVWTGVPNLYNRMDVVIRADHDPGLTFPVLEAAACGIPFIATDVGIESLFEKAGAGIVIKADEVNRFGDGRSWYFDPNTLDEQAKRFREAIIWMRDNSKEREKMGWQGRQEILRNWTWEKQLPKWKEFFTLALELADAK